jgi:hypothetical protein
MSGYSFGDEAIAQAAVGGGSPSRGSDRRLAAVVNEDFGGNAIALAWD